MDVCYKIDYCNNVVDYCKESGFIFELGKSPHLEQVDHIFQKWLQCIHKKKYKLEKYNKGTVLPVCFIKVSDVLFEENKVEIYKGYIKNCHFQVLAKLSVIVMDKLKIIGI